jgi:predicted ATPase/DNA-binding CsgD family transcriptional regulator
VASGVAIPPAQAPLTSFVGRRQELGQLRSLLSACRLVTLIGPGGSGKTRLAEELLSGLNPTAGSVAFAYLAGAGQPPDVIEVVAAAVGLRNRSHRAAETQLVDFLRSQRVVLLLDNCEHVIVAAAGLAATLLHACLELRVLATSRQPLHVPGEQLLPIGGLAHEPAVELFADRVRLTIPDFASETVRPPIEGICGRLDGMPLAIELAAAQVRNLGVHELTRRIDGHLDELASRSPVVPERQRTLRGTIDWSHGLLTSTQQVVWRRLSAFVGGFTLEAAETVSGFPPIERRDVAGLIGDLVDQSMVVFDAANSRYRMLEALHEYASDRLREAEEDTIVAERHRAWMVELATDTDLRWFGAQQVELMDRMEAELGNLRAALDNCAASGAFEDGLRLVIGAGWFWLTRASLDEGLRWFSAFLDQSNDPALEARASWRAEYLAVLRLAFPAAHAHSDRALQSAAVAGTPLEAAYTRAMDGALNLYEHPDQADETRRICRSVIDDPAADRMARQYGLLILAGASLALRDFEGARRAGALAAEIGREVGDLWGLELALRYVAHADWQLGRPAIAEESLLECLRLDRRLGDVLHLAWSTEALGWVTVDTGRFERGARLIGIASAMWVQTGSHLADTWQRWRGAAMETLRSRLGGRRAEAEIDTGRAMSQSEALAFALGETDTASRPSSVAQALSERELEVAALLAQGLGNRAIADRLFLSPRTVEKHIEHVMDKLGVGSRAQVAAWHARQGAAGQS